MCLLWPDQQLFKWKKPPGQQGRKFLQVFYSFAFLDVSGKLLDLPGAHELYHRGWEQLCQTLPPEDSHLTSAWLLCSKSQPLNVTTCPECVIWAELNISRADKNLPTRLIMHWLTAPHAVACPEGRQLCTEVTFLLSCPRLTKDGKCQRNRTVPLTIRGNFTSWLSVLEGAGIYRQELKSLGEAWIYLPWYGRDVNAWQQWLCTAQWRVNQVLTQLHCSFQSILSFGLKFPRAVKIIKEWQQIS